MIKQIRNVLLAVLFVFSATAHTGDIAVRSGMLDRLREGND